MRNERVTGVEPVLRPWEGHVLPLYYTRIIDFKELAWQDTKYAILVSSI